MKKTLPAMKHRPTCSVKGCDKAKQYYGVWSKKTNQPLWRNKCTMHHMTVIAKKQGTSLTEYYSAAKERAAKKQGMSVAEYRRAEVAKAAKKQGMSVAEYQSAVRARTAKKHGFSSVIKYRNSKHPDRKHRKTYCENRDKRLGFICRYTIKYSGQLQVDHKNGNPYDHRKCNLQTLCANCHIFKTSVNKDYATPGRKQLRSR